MRLSCALSRLSMRVSVSEPFEFHNCIEPLPAFVRRNPVFVRWKSGVLGAQSIGTACAFLFAAEEASQVTPGARELWEQATRFTRRATERNYLGAPAPAVFFFIAHSVLDDMVGVSLTKTPLARPRRSSVLLRLSIGL